MPMDRILDGLNEQQRCAVTSTASVLQVLAPPGSGKTKTLTTRVAYLIEHDKLRPWNIIVCTFTIKAAREMKDRIRGFIGEKLESKLILGTFHSIALKYLKIYGHYIGIPKDFGVADSSDSLAICKRLIKRHQFNLEASKARSRISRRKATAEGKQQKRGPPNVETQEFEELFVRYQDTLQGSGLLDYDDLLLRCVDLLQQHPECASNIEAVLVDEFQDTNNVQYRLMTLFAQHRNSSSSRKPPSIAIVGDPDQSIYSFRSAEVGNLTKMQKQYQDTQVILLEDNYRSSGAILSYAMKVIEQDQSRLLKRMQSTHDYGSIPVLRELANPKQEAFWLVREIKRITSLTPGLLSYSDFAVLIRSASLSRLIEQELGLSGIPYRMIGGHKFFDRKEVKLLLDYMRVISQPDHSDAMLRIVNEPPRGIGDVTTKVLIEAAESRSWSLWKLVKSEVRSENNLKLKISKQASDGLSKFFHIIMKGQQKLRNLQAGTDTLLQLLNHIEQSINLDTYLASQSPDKESLETRKENIAELKQQAASIAIDCDEMLDEDSLVQVPGVEQEKITGPQAALSRFLTNVALATDAQAAGQDGNNELVTISTIHAAKGLEWPVVFIPSAYHGSIPHSRSDDADEERRLLYVGMTRAQALLYLSWPLQKTNDENHILSSFLKEDDIHKEFTERGPSLDCDSSLQGIARILRRDCPISETLREARSQSSCPYDIDIVIEGQQSGLAGRMSEAFEERVHPHKRVKMTAGAGSVSTYTTTVNSSYNAVMSSSSVNTGCTLYSGFTSAASLKSEIDRQESMVTKTKALPRQPSAKAQNKPKSKLPPPSQSTISSFFGRNKKSVEQDDELPTVNVSSARGSVLSESMNSFGRNYGLVSVNTCQASTRNIRRGAANPRKFDAAEEEQFKAETKYVLLSSSPVKPDTRTLMEEIQKPVVDENRPPATDESLTNSSCQLQNAASSTTLFKSGLGAKRLGVGKPRSWAELTKAKISKS